MNNCDKCIDWLEGQQPPRDRYHGNERPEKIVIEDLQSWTARIARLEERKQVLRRLCLSVDTSVPALSSNTCINSIVQAIHGREIGFKKPYTEKLYDNLFEHNMYDTIRRTHQVQYRHLHILEIDPPEYHPCLRCNKNLAQSSRSFMDINISTVRKRNESS